MFLKTRTRPLKALLVSGFALFGLSLALVGYVYYQAPINKLKDVYPIVQVLNPEGDFRIHLKENKPYNWISVDNISESAVWAIVISEDWAFYNHNGVDFNQLMRAVTDKFKKSKILRGASTITQQTIKNIFFDSSRSFIRKFKELIYTIKLERNFSKKQILEMYLNIIEFDRNVFGIYMASFHYFNKHPKYLNAREGAFLAMVLPSPKRYSESFRDQKLTEFAGGVIDKILVKMRQAKVIDESQRQLEVNKKYYWENEDKLKSAGQDTDSIQL